MQSYNLVILLFSPYPSIYSSSHDQRRTIWCRSKHWGTRCI